MISELYFNSYNRYSKLHTNFIEFHVLFTSKANEILYMKIKSIEHQRSLQIKASTNIYYQYAYNI